MLAGDARRASLPAGGFVIPAVLHASVKSWTACASSLLASTHTSSSPASAAASSLDDVLESSCTHRFVSLVPLLAHHNARTRAASVQLFLRLASLFHPRLRVSLSWLTSAAPGATGPGRSSSSSSSSSTSSTAGHVHLSPSPSLTELSLGQPSAGTSASTSTSASAGAVDPTSDPRNLSRLSTVIALQLGRDAAAATDLFFHCIGGALRPLVVAAVAGLEAFYVHPVQGSPQRVRDVCLSAAARLIYENAPLFAHAESLRAVWHMLFLLDSLAQHQGGFRVAVCEALRLLSPVYALGLHDLRARVVAKLLGLPAKSDHEIDVIRDALQRVFALAGSEASSASSLYPVFLDLISANSDANYDLLCWAVTEYTRALDDTQVPSNLSLASSSSSSSSSGAEPAGASTPLAAFVEHLTSHLTAAPDLIRFGAFSCLTALIDARFDVIAPAALLPLVLAGIFDSHLRTAQLCVHMLRTVTGKLSLKRSHKAVSLYLGRFEKPAEAHGISLDTITETLVVEASGVLRARSSSSPVPSLMLSLAKGLSFIPLRFMLQRLHLLRHLAACVGADALDPLLVQELMPFMQHPDKRARFAVVRFFDRLAPALVALSPHLFNGFHMFFHGALAAHTTDRDSLLVALSALPSFPYEHLAHDNRRAELLDRLLALALHPSQVVRLQVYTTVVEASRFWAPSVSLRASAAIVLLLGLSDTRVAAVDCAVSGICRLLNEPTDDAVHACDLELGRVVAEQREALSQRSVLHRLQAYARVAACFANPTKLKVSSLCAAIGRGLKREQTVVLLRRLIQMTSPASVASGANAGSSQPGPASQRLSHHIALFILISSHFSIPLPLDQHQAAFSDGSAVAKVIDSPEYSILLALSRALRSRSAQTRHVACHVIKRACVLDPDTTLNAALVEALVVYLPTLVSAQAGRFALESGFYLGSLLVPLRIQRLEPLYTSEHVDVALSMLDSDNVSPDLLRAVLLFLEAAMQVQAAAFASHLERMRDRVRELLCQSEGDVLRALSRLYALVTYTATRHTAAGAGGASEAFYMYFEDDVSASLPSHKAQRSADPLLSKLNAAQLMAVSLATVNAMGYIAADQQLAMKMVAQLTPLLHHASSTYRLHALRSVFRLLPCVAAAEGHAEDLAHVWWVCLPLMGDADERVRSVFARGPFMLNTLVPNAERGTWWPLERLEPPAGAFDEDMAVRLLAVPDTLVPAAHHLDPVDDSPARDREVALEWCSNPPLVDAKLLEQMRRIVALRLVQFDTMHRLLSSEAAHEPLPIDMSIEVPAAARDESSFPSERFGEVMYHLQAFLRLPHLGGAAALVIALAANYAPDTLARSYLNSLLLVSEQSITGSSRSLVHGATLGVKYLVAQCTEWAAPYVIEQASQRAVLHPADLQVLRFAVRHITAAGASIAPPTDPNDERPPLRRLCDDSAVRVLVSRILRVLRASSGVSIRDKASALPLLVSFSYSLDAGSMTPLVEYIFELLGQSEDEHFHDTCALQLGKLLAQLDAAQQTAERQEIERLVLSMLEVDTRASSYRMRLRGVTALGILAASFSHALTTSKRNAHLARLLSDPVPLVARHTLKTVLATFPSVDPIAREAARLAEERRVDMSDPAEDLVSLETMSDEQLAELQQQRHADASRSRSPVPESARRRGHKRLQIPLRDDDELNLTYLSSDAYRRILDSYGLDPDAVQGQQRVHARGQDGSAAKSFVSSVDDGGDGVERQAVVASLMASYVNAEDLAELTATVMAVHGDVDKAVVAELLKDTKSLGADDDDSGRGDESPDDAASKKPDVADGDDGDVAEPLSQAEQIEQSRESFARKLHGVDVLFNVLSCASAGHVRSNALREVCDLSQVYAERMSRLRERVQANVYALSFAQLHAGFAGGRGGQPGAVTTRFDEYDRLSKQTQLLANASLDGAKRKQRLAENRQLQDEISRDSEKLHMLAAMQVRLIERVGELFQQAHTQSQRGFYPDDEDVTAALQWAMSMFGQSHRDVRDAAGRTFLDIVPCARGQNASAVASAIPTRLFDELTESPTAAMRLGRRKRDIIRLLTHAAPKHLDEARQRRLVPLLISLWDDIDTEVREMAIRMVLHLGHTRMKAFLDYVRGSGDSARASGAGGKRAATGRSSSGAAAGSDVLSPLMVEITKRMNQASYPSKQLLSQVTRWFFRFQRAEEP